MSEFKYLTDKKIKKTLDLLNNVSEDLTREEILLEIAYQLKRISDQE